MKQKGKKLAFAIIIGIVLIFAVGFLIANSFSNKPDKNMLQYKDVDFTPYFNKLKIEVELDSKYDSDKQIDFKIAYKYIEKGKEKIEEFSTENILLRSGKNLFVLENKSKDYTYAHSFKVESLYVQIEGNENFEQVFYGESENFFGFNFVFVSVGVVFVVIVFGFVLKVIIAKKEITNNGGDTTKSYTEKIADAFSKQNDKPDVKNDIIICKYCKAGYNPSKGKCPHCGAPTEYDQK